MAQLRVFLKKDITRQRDLKSIEPERVGLPVDQRGERQSRGHMVLYKKNLSAVEGQSSTGETASAAALQTDMRQEPELADYATFLPDTAQNRLRGVAAYTQPDIAGRNCIDKYSERQIGWFNRGSSSREVRHAKS